jgi:lipopolysaccharide/colanic/teichoic acid biosynthesis glycosyltransferase
MVKFVFDRVFAFFGLLLALPLLLLISLLVLIRDGRPVFFVQRRVGRHGKLFPMVKFRTMKPNDGRNTVSVKGDTRITRTGAFLRKYKLDELPGLWNVLVGHMSFVGPRPDVPGYADLLQGEDRLILNLRPGITGPATLKYAHEEELLAAVDNPVKYNDEVIFPDKVRINLAYYRNHNILTDIRIIFDTLFKRSST